MRRTILSAAALLLAGAACYAQDFRDVPEVLNRLRNESASFDYTYFVATGKDAEPQETSGGCVTVQSDAYVATGFGLEVRADADTRWTIDRSAKEVLIEKAGAARTGEILLTPTLAVCRLDEFFDIRFVEHKLVSRSGGTVDRYELTPKTPTADMSEVYLFVSSDLVTNPILLQNYPDQDVTYWMTFGFRSSDATWVEIRTGEINFAPRKDLSFYRPAAGEFDGKEWVVTDLR